MKKIILAGFVLMMASLGAKAQDSLRIYTNDGYAYNYAIGGITRITVNNQTEKLPDDSLSLPKAIAQAGNLKIFNHLLEVTGWATKLLNYSTLNFQKFDTYEDYLLENASGQYVPYLGKNVPYPERRNYGFTAFVEPDELFSEKWGIQLNVSEGVAQNWDEVMTTIISRCAQYYPSATSQDLTSEDNAVNQFVSYHLLKGGIPLDRLVIHYNEMGYAYTEPDKLSIDAWEYYETMGAQRRMMKITEGAQTGGKRINRHATYDLSNYKEVNVDRSGIKIDANPGEALNGYYYTLDDILVYDNDVPNKVLNERLRFDMASLFPELTTNGLRSRAFKEYAIPQNYLDNASWSSETTAQYFTGYGKGWSNYQGDDFDVTGQYDVTFRLPPVPYEGTFEIRLGSTNLDIRGMAQAYLGTDKSNLVAIGQPIDFRLRATNPQIGFEADGADQSENDLVDQNMRNKGYMKSPLYFGFDSKTGVAVSLRNSSSPMALRKIIWRGMMSPEKTYYLRLKSVLETSTELLLDYIELVPKVVYDGNTAEDKW